MQSILMNIIVTLLRRMLNSLKVLELDPSQYGNYQKSASLSLFISDNHVIDAKYMKEYSFVYLSVVL